MLGFLSKGRVILHGRYPKEPEHDLDLSRDHRNLRRYGNHRLRICWNL